MTARERLFAALRGEPTDKVPIWLLFPYHRLGCYVDVRTLPAYRPIVELAEKYAITLNRRHLGAPFYKPEVKQWREETFENGWKIVRDFTEYKGRRLVSEARYGTGSSSIRRLLNDESDLELFCSLPVETDRARLEATLDANLPAYRREVEEFPAHLGAMMFDLGEPIGPLYSASNIEEYAIWSLTHDEPVRSFLDQAMQRMRIIYDYCLRRELADVYFLVGSELASPPLVSRQTFRRWIVPYAAELIDRIRRAGKFAIQHYHGQIREILPDFVEMAPHGLHTIEAPPTGNCTFTQAYEAVGDRITLIGNIQYDEFRRLTDEQMAQAVRDVLDECRGKRLILSPSAGPFDADLSERTARNYLAFLETAWRYDWA
ncbi:MAG TPA: hypothetical protein DCX07_11345 [Phycisphaerales bacterium]|nr:hypothetical protein [Phycisphaerales bacterium]